MGDFGIGFANASAGQAVNGNGKKRKRPLADQPQNGQETSKLSEQIFKPTSLQAKRLFGKAFIT